MKHIRGFTAIEIAFSVVIFGVIMASATQAVIVDTSAERVMLAEMGPEAKAQRALRKLTGELRMAGLTGEDTNGNGELDPGEDMNDNDELDADWNLADEVENQDNLVFNRRVELREHGEPDNAVPSTVYSRKITYRVLNKRLMRIATSTDYENETVKSRAYVMARGVDAVRFSRAGRVITVEIDLIYDARTFQDRTRTITEKVYLRN